MRHKTYVSLVIVFSLLVVGWLVSGAFTPELPTGLPRGATPVEPSGLVTERTTVEERGFVARFDGAGEIAVSVDGGFEFSRYAFPSGETPRDLTSIRPVPSGGVILTDPRYAWFADEGSAMIERLSVPQMNENTVVTCAARAGSAVVIGTSFEGLWASDDSGKTWRNITQHEVFDFMYRGARFYEQIADCAIDPETMDLFVALDFGNGFYRISGGLPQRAPRSETPSSDVPPSNAAPQVTQLHLPATESVESLQSFFAVGSVDRKAEPDPEPLDRARERHGIYLSAKSAGKDNLTSYLELLRENRFDSVVVDFKDDEGMLTYETTLAKPRDIGAVAPQFDAPTLIETAADHDIYLIARIVVFKDRSLYYADRYAYAVWDRRFDGPWARRIRFEDPESGETRIVQREHWVDPYARDVWQYNIDIALELESLGVDEIQFDYIRFPSDGPTEHAVYRHAEENADRVDALAGFLSTAREQLSIPIGIDVFGFNAWFRTRYLGQDIAVLSRHVDVISPMNYPSHFSRAFLPEMTYFERSRHIYSHGSERAQAIAGPNTIIRPYVQAFLIGTELEYEEPEYSQYLIDQLEGTLDSPADGFTLWNASGRYYMVTPQMTRSIAPRLPLRSSRDR